MSDFWSDFIRVAVEPILNNLRRVGDQVWYQDYNDVDHEGKHLEEEHDLQSCRVVAIDAIDVVPRYGTVFVYRVVFEDGVELQVLNDELVDSESQLCPHENNDEHSWKYRFNEEPLPRCPYCQREFRNPAAWEIHLQENHVSYGISIPMRENTLRRRIEAAEP